MKAFILAAGYGTRLRPLTDVTPKCLVPVKNRPLLGWWIELLKKHGISEVLINTHYLPEKVNDYVRTLDQSDIKIRLVYEKELLGSGGMVKKNINFIDNDETFLICYADNLTSVNLTKLIKYHKKNSEIITIALFHTDKPKQCGIVTMNEAGVITEFVEKPSEPKSNLANAGIYVADKEIMNYFPDREVIDFGKDVLPLLVNKMRGYILDEYLLDIGTPENYKQANEEWENDYI